MCQIIFHYFYNCWISFFVLVAIWSNKAHFFIKKTCLRIHCNLKKINFTQQFFRQRAWSGTHQMFDRKFYDFWVSFSALTVVRGYVFYFLSRKCLRMHCNFKIWIFSNSFLGTGHNQSHTQNFFSTSNFFWDQSFRN